MDSGHSLSAEQAFEEAGLLLRCLRCRRGLDGCRSLRRSRCWRGLALHLDGITHPLDLLGLGGTFFRSRTWCLNHLKLGLCLTELEAHFLKLRNVLFSFAIHLADNLVSGLLINLELNVFIL